MKKFIPETDSQLLSELQSHLTEGQRIVDALKIRESMLACWAQVFFSESLDPRKHGIPLKFIGCVSYSASVICQHYRPHRHEEGAGFGECALGDVRPSVAKKERTKGGART